MATLGISICFFKLNVCTFSISAMGTSFSTDDFDTSISEVGNYVQENTIIIIIYQATKIALKKMAHITSGCISHVPLTNDVHWRAIEEGVKGKTGNRQSWESDLC